MSDTLRPAGQPYQVPQRGPVMAEQVAPLVAALGPGWKDCGQVQPWQDCGSALRYVVYSPSYLGALLVCRFDLFSPARWWHEGMQLGISGVTHWRLANDDDQDYAELLSDEDRTRILKALASTVAEQGLGAARSWGDRNEDRGSQITLSGLGQRAPLDAKQAWDADSAERMRRLAALVPLLPDFAVRAGGSASIDISRKGIGKADGMAKLAKASGMPADEMIFIGDVLYPGGNDYPVHEADIDTIGVRDVTETRRVTEAIALCVK